MVSHCLRRYLDSWDIKEGDGKEVEGDVAQSATISQGLADDPRLVITKFFSSKLAS